MDRFIKKIEIRNFRSIKNSSIELSNLAIFCGLNDVGKSNVLKALNLFFNNQTDYNQLFNYNRDYCLFSDEKFIEVTLTLQKKLGRTRNNREYAEFKWSKRWDTIGVVKDTFELVEQSTSHNAVGSINPSHKDWARQLRYRYVPAFKDITYFNDIKTELYYLLAESINANEMNLNFTETIRRETKELESALSEKIGINTNLGLPNSNYLFDLFKALDFQTSSFESNSVPLFQRGDGVKIRHVPNILFFLDFDKNNGENNIIWGYEEPESFLELSAAFKEAELFTHFIENKNIQILLTTHSPAFYLLGERENINCEVFHVTNKGSSGTTYHKANLIETNNELGLIQLVSPFIQKVQAELDSIKNELEEYEQNSRNTIYVEGKTDEQYIKKALEVFEVDTTNLEISYIGKDSHNGNMGTGETNLDGAIQYLRNNHTKYSNKFCILYDCDVKDTKCNSQLEVPRKLIIRKHTQLSNNRNMTKGVENLLVFPDELNSQYLKEHFFEFVEENKGYGELAIIPKLDKQKLADKICSYPNEQLKDILQNVFNSIKPIIDELEQM